MFKEIVINADPHETRVALLEDRELVELLVERADRPHVLGDIFKGKINAVFTHNDEMSLGAIQAIKEAGRSGEIKVVGIDGETDGLKAVKSGAYAGTVVYPIDVPEHLIAAARVCAHESLPPRIKMSALLVTKANVSQFEGKTF